MATRTMILILIAAALTLTGCGSAAVTPATTPVAEKTNAPVQEPTTQPEPTLAEPALQPEATDMPVTPTEESLGEGQTRYQIVATESEVIYEVGETFLNQENRYNLAVGVTTDVEGEILIDRLNPQNSTISAFTINISKFTSDSSRRDNVIRNDWLESTRYPLAVFTPTSIEGLPAEGVEGQQYELRISGDLQVKEVVRPVTFTATVSVTGNELTGKAETTILMSDFGVGPISIAGILNTEDEVHIIFNIIARAE